MRFIGGVIREDKSHIVVGDFQGNNGLKGFFVQAEESQIDNNPATSEGIFVYEGDSSQVEVQVHYLLQS